MTKAEAERAAHAIVNEAEACEYCHAAPATDPHEIARGNGVRKLARGKRSCTLALCRACHNLMGGMSRARQVLILYRSRPDDCNVIELWNVTGRRFPTIESLIEEAMRWGAENVIKRDSRGGG